MSEDPVVLLKHIKDMYSIFEFDPLTAKDFIFTEIDLLRHKHKTFIEKGFQKLPSGMVGVDSGQPWFLYWLTQGMETLTEGDEEYLTATQKKKAVSYLRQNENYIEGGFGGMPHTMSHVASSYAAMLATVNIGTEQAFEAVHVEGMLRFLKSVKNNQEYASSTGNMWCQVDPATGKEAKSRGVSDVKASLPGSVEIHRNGEMDMRGIYCALVIADILGILKSHVAEELTEGMGDFIASCQTYEGGISCVPYGEAHGGYTFCGLAALILLEETHKINLDRLAEWLANRQLQEEGGFNGRINKLVDSCYNFWQGATFELLDIALKGEGNVCGEWLYNQEALQGYTLFCCQDSKVGGLKDKPTKGPDYYHTAYALSGMSNSQYKSDYENLHGEEPQISEVFNGYYDAAILEVEEGEEEKQAKEEPADKTILLSGLYSNLLRRMHPIFNVRYDKLAKAKHFFYEKKMLSSPQRRKE